MEGEVKSTEEKGRISKGPVKTVTKREHFPQMSLTILKEKSAEGFLVANAPSFLTLVMTYCLLTVDNLNVCDIQQRTMKDRIP